MKKIVFETIKVRRLSETVENYLKDLIIDRQVKPGERLPTEKELSVQFGVSSVTVREALRGLETFGLILKKKGKNGGIFVSEAKMEMLKTPLYSYLSAKRLSAYHLSQVRMIIEPPIIRIAVSKMTLRDMRALDQNVKFCENIVKERKDGLSERQLQELKEKTVEFHKLLAETTRNPILTLTLDYVLDFLFTFQKAGFMFEVEFMAQAVREHRVIFSRLEARDAPGAEKELVSHLQQVGKYLKKKESNTD